ncbi:hypothetical protein ACHAPE_007242 [Trichoderma viride]
MSSTTSYGNKASRRPWSFHSALRWDRLPLWRQTVQANDFGVMNAVLCISVDGVLLSTEDQAALWRDFKYPRGIRVLHKWTATHLPPNELDGYNGMSRDALVNFADAVVCDMIPKGLLFVATRFDVDIKPLFPDGISNILPGLSPNMVTLYTDILSNWDVSAPTRRLINPTDLVAAYIGDIPLKNTIDMIATSLTVPTFLPITGNMVHETVGRDDVIDARATILAQAIQILVFAPTQWYPEIVYRRDSTGYTHRYPTPAGHGGNGRTVAGKFSLEDLHRSILLMYLAIARRDPTSAFGQPPLGQTEFLGYYYDAQTPEPV